MNRILVVLAFIFINQLLFSQEDPEVDKEIDEIIDNLITLDDAYLIDLINEVNNYKIIIASLDFNDKTYFLGRDLGINQFSISPQLMYKNSNGIYAGVAGAYYDKFDPKWDLTILTAGYGKFFGKHKNLKGELGYSRYIFSDTDSNDFENSIDGSFSIRNKNDYYGSIIDASYLFGKRTGFQTNIAVYGTIKLFDLGTTSDAEFVLVPNVSFLLASENIDTSRIDRLGIDLPYINRVVNSFEKFSLRNVQLNLPIQLDYDNFLLELGYNFNFPSSFEFEREVKNTSFFNLGFTYFFDLN
ncbi:hypothetical protein UMM65_01575 [Aureibaculum sp. 2210JD6-5]|uniref:hypothetical protein n=1 Tax=Aureibaculum sp. 2210JD6-5 TaxID=3103957 RepID=UPI002AAEB894|nr:hypothetical protein [Aureibaculum sp. 2210JD6-5]MDY7393922.1 hypothetical protein [Aureibaculum sp. 2210JD6-5]